MKTKLIKLISIIILLCLSGGVTVSAYAKEQGAATGIAFSASAMTVETGGTLALNAVITPADAADKTLLWSSSDANVAAVDGYGFVTGVSKGTATITAAAADGSGSKAAIRINVITTVKAIEISGPNDMTAGKSIRLAAAVSPSDATNKKVVWSSSDTNVVSVSSSGKVTAKKIGSTKTVTVTAQAADGSGVFGSLLITVRPAAAAVSIWRGIDDVTGRTLSIDLAAADKTIRLSASVSPEDAGQGILWTTSSAGVAKVDGNGLVTGLSKGTATITASASDGSGRKAKIRITAATMVKSIEITGPNTVTAGKSIRLAAAVSPSDATNKKVVWSSSDTNVVTVNSEGKVTAKKVGSTKTATVTATAKDGSGVFGIILVTVKPAAAAVIIWRGIDDVTGRTLGVDPVVDKTIQLSANVSPVDAGQGVLWTTSNGKVASVDGTGRVTCLSNGTAVITAAAADGSRKKATVTLSILPAPAAPILTPTPTPRPEAMPMPITTPTETELSFEKTVADLVNMYRAENDLPPLTLSAELSGAARIKSRDMCDKNYFAHISPTYGSAADMLIGFNISFSYMGENIAKGFSSAEQVVNSWMNSPGHRANILNPNYKQIGVGHVSNGGIWTQIFVG
jgi:uncharacterized YkwD family protein